MKKGLYGLMLLVLIGNLTACGKVPKTEPPSETLETAVSTAPLLTKSETETESVPETESEPVPEPETIPETEPQPPETEPETVGELHERDTIPNGNPNEFPPAPEPVREIAVKPLKSPETWRQTLSGEALTLYDTFYQAFLNYETVIPAHVDPDEIDIDEIADYVLEDHPEIFWYEYYHQWYPLTLSLGNHDPEALRDNVFKIELQEGLSVEQLGNARAELEQKVAEILSCIPENATADEKVLFVHDYLVKYTIAVENMEIYYNAYDCLVNHESMCNGYTKAFTLLMNQLDIPAGQVLGDIGEYHTWNYVMLDGNYYWLDVTLDDNAVFEPLPMNFVNHNYYCITDEQILRNHTIDSSNSLFVPQCVSTDKNYFRTHNAFVETYHFEDVKQMIQENQIDGCTQLQFSSMEQLQLASNDLFTQGNHFLETDIVRGKNAYWHYAHEDMLTLIIDTYLE